MVRIIAQGQFDVNEENIEGEFLVGSSTGTRMVFSFRMSDFASVSEDRGEVLIETFLMCPASSVPCPSRATGMYE